MNHLDLLQPYRPRVEPLVPEAAEEEKENAKKVVANPGTPVAQDTVVSFKDAPALTGLAPEQKSTTKGWSQKDTLSIAEEKERSHPTEELEEGYFGALARYISGWASSLRNLFNRESQAVTPDQRPSGFKAPEALLDSHAVVHSSLDENHKRLERDLAKLLDKAEAMRKEMQKCAGPGMGKDMDAIFLLLLRLMMSGKEKEFLVAKEQLGKKYREREDDLNKRWSELQNLRNTLLKNDLWQKIENGSMYLTKATLIGAAAWALEPTIGWQWAVIGAAAVLFADIKKEPIAKEIAKASSAILVGTEQSHAEFWYSTLGMGLTIAEIGAGGVAGANKYTIIVNLLSSTSQGIAGMSRANSDHQKSLSQGRMGKIDSDLREDGEDISSGTKKLSTALKNRNDHEKDLIKRTQEMHDLLISLTRNIRS